MSKKSRRRNKMLAALALGLGASKMMKPDVSDAKMMKASDMNKLRVPASVKNRKKFKDAFMPKGNILGQDFGIDPFGPGMGAKKGKMIKAMGGTMVTRGQGRVMRTKKTKLI